jgi:CBS domain-containing protein
MATRVSEVMSRDVVIVRPEDSIQEAAFAMGRIDAGALPVGDDDRLVGMITDRDIAIRAVGEGRGPDCKVGDIMTPEVKYCFEDEDINHVARNLGQQQIRRLPVVNRQKRLVGIIALADIAQQNAPPKTGAALRDISQPGGMHSQMH